MVGFKWIYKIKEVIQSHAFSKGFMCKEGIDFNDVLSSVMRHSSLRILVAIVSINDLNIWMLKKKNTS